MVHRLSCSASCGIFPDQGSNPCLLRLPREAPKICFFIAFISTEPFPLPHKHRRQDGEEQGRGEMPSLASEVHPGAGQGLAWVSSQGPLLLSA